MEKFENVKELFLERRYLIIAIGIIVLLIGSIVLFCYFNKENYNSEKIELNEELVSDDIEIVKEEKEENCIVKVDIKGEVIKPGLYTVNCDDRVQDVINLAGGITDLGDTSVLNLGKIVHDEMVIIVYSKKDAENIEQVIEKEKEEIKECITKTEIKNDACIENVLPSITIDNNDNVSSTEEIIGDTPVKVLVSINRALKEELMTLSGIGESKANNIINYRNEHGGFKSLEEIKNVKGIGESIFAKIKDDITL